MNLGMRCACLALVLLVVTRAHADEPAGYSPAQLYNLANSYARAGKTGMAILNYERAGLLAPNDPDLEANLRLVQKSAHLPSESRNAFERFAGVATPEEFAWIAVFGFVAVGVGAVVGQLSSRYRLLRGAVMAAGTLMVAWTLCSAITVWPKLHEGVIIAASAPAHVSPVPMADTVFVLPEGETVRIAAQHEGFTLVRTRTGRSGWLADSTIAPVVPRHP